MGHRLASLRSSLSTVHILSAVSSGLMKLYGICRSTGTLDKNTHKASLPIDWLMKMLWSKALGPYCISPGSQGPGFTNLVLEVTLSNVIATNKGNQLYISCPSVSLHLFFFQPLSSVPKVIKVASFFQAYFNCLEAPAQYKTAYWVPSRCGLSKEARV